MMMASERTTLLGQMLKLEDEELKIALASGSSMIICGGIIDLMLGFMALCSPIAATYASYSLVTALFYVVSIVSSFFFVLFLFITNYVKLTLLLLYIGCHLSSD